MAKIFHGGIKIKGEEGKVALKKSYLEKRPWVGWSKRRESARDRESSLKIEYVEVI